MAWRPLTACAHSEPWAFFGSKSEENKSSKKNKNVVKEMEASDKRKILRLEVRGN
jgi:hypothetical protein